MKVAVFLGIFIGFSSEVAECSAKGAESIQKIAEFPTKGAELIQKVLNPRLKVLINPKDC